jgi:Putative Flp pilus-assembly TadE/G-like
MNTNCKTIVSSHRRSAFSLIACKVLKDERGQTLPFVALLMTALLGMAGLVTDVGHAYVVRGELQNSANAAALAASGYVYTSQSASVNTTSIANQYSASSGGSNASSGLGTVNTSVKTRCVNMLMPKGTTCGSSSIANAVVVTNSATVKTIFMALFGVKTLAVNATATASMQGSSKPWNVAVIIDSTGSMATVDSNCNNMTEFQCALSGTQALLEDTNPCPTGISSCGGSTGVAPVVRVSLFTFPNVLTSQNGTAVPSVSDDINCNGNPATFTNFSSQPVAAPYTLPIPGVTLPGAPDATYMTYKQTSNSQPWTATYQITPFLSDYYLPSNSTGLNPNSDLVKAVGHGNTLGCLTYTFGIWGTGSGSGFGNTYLASVLYAAQSALAAEQTANGGQNAIVFLSDGDANASYYSKNPSAYGGVTTSNQFSNAFEFPSAPSGSRVGPTSSSPSNPVPSYFTPATSNDTTTDGYSTLGVNGKGIYPDWFDQCQQAITAAQYATNQGTTVFSVAYGAGGQGGGCSSGWSVGQTDTTLTATGTNQTFSLGSLSPCVVMTNVASSLATFYSDPQQSGSSSSCTDAGHTTVSLQQIFQGIATTFSSPRLIPNNAPGTAAS